MAIALRVSLGFFVMGIYGAKFQEQRFNISRDIVYSVFKTFQLQHCDIIKLKNTLEVSFKMLELFLIRHHLPISR